MNDLTIMSGAIFTTASGGCGTPRQRSKRQRYVDQKEDWRGR